MLDFTIAILFVALLMATYFCIFNIIVPKGYNKNKYLLLGIVLAFVYVCIIGFVGLMYYYTYYNIWVIWGAIMIVGLVGFAYMVSSAVRNWLYLDKIYVVLIILYLGVVAYMTLISRLGNTLNWTNITRFIPFVDLQAAVAMHSFAPIEHVIKNTLLFVPFGVLLHLVDTEKMNRVGYIALFGMSISTLIETLQHILSLGMFDVDDIISNTLGAIIGYYICVIFKRILKEKNN